MGNTNEMPVSEPTIPEIQTHLTLGDMQDKAKELASLLDEMYEEPLKMKEIADQIVMDNEPKQKELLEKYYNETGVKFQPKFDSQTNKFSVVITM